MITDLWTVGGEGLFLKRLIIFKEKMFEIQKHWPFNPPPPQVCHSKSGEVDASKVANLVKAYVDKYKHSRKNKTDKNWGSRRSAARTSAIPPPQEPVFHRPLRLELLFVSENSNEDFSIDCIIFV